MIAVTTNNTSFDEKFANNRCKASFSLYFKKDLLSSLLGRAWDLNVVSCHLTGGGHEVFNLILSHMSAGRSSLIAVHNYLTTLVQR